MNLNYCLLTFSHILYWKNIWELHVIMESHVYKLLFLFIKDPLLMNLNQQKLHNDC